MNHSQPLFHLFLFFWSNVDPIKLAHFSGIRSLIVGVQGKLADHLTTSTASYQKNVFPNFFYFQNVVVFDVVAVHKKTIKRPTTTIGGHIFTTAIANDTGHTYK